MLMCDATGLSQRRACRLTGLSLSTCRYEAHRPAADAHLSGRITELALEHRRFGYRRIWQLLRREGLHVNHKRVYRLYHLSGLGVKRRRRRKGLATERLPLLRPAAPNLTWSMDFVMDALSTGRRIKCLTCVDDFTKECLTVTVAFGISGVQVSRILDSIALFRGYPGVDVFLPKSGSTLVVPQQLILPDTVREGIVINVAEMRLYYYPAGSNTVEVLPIDIGQAGRETPRNWVTAVERKQEAPSWTPTPNTRREYAARGESLPAFVPAGPENPMGLYAIYIGRLYAIHGTNANFGIGLRVSQGCIRLRNDDIKHLFDTVPVGTRVQLIDRPVKYSEEPDGSRWVEVHEPLSRNRSEYESDRKVPLSVTPALRTFISGNDVDVSRGSQALERRSGMPVNISLVQKHY